MAGRSQYQAKGDVYFGDGREEELRDYVQSKCAGQAKVADILQLIDDFGASNKYLMNVGHEKGSIVTSLIKQRKPRVMIELGSYVGYSTLLFAETMRDQGGERYISFERSEVFADITRTFVRMAGLNDVVTVIVGPSSKNLVAEHKAGRLDRVDLAFIDHYKPAYLRDIKVCESLGLIQPDTWLVADNVITPGNPPYLQYVRSTPEERKRLARGDDDSSNKDDQFPTWTTSQYDQPYEEDEAELPGVPEVVYESRLIESFEPTGDPDGLEVTVCKSVPG